MKNFSRASCLLHLSQQRDTQQCSMLYELSLNLQVLTDLPAEFYVLWTDSSLAHKQLSIYQGMGRYLEKCGTV